MDCSSKSAPQPRAHPAPASAHAASTPVAPAAQSFSAVMPAGPSPAVSPTQSYDAPLANRVAAATCPPGAAPVVPTRQARRRGRQRRRSLMLCSLS
eukprot:360999-Chlamydomonas_euryale.AAC.6